MRGSGVGVGCKRVVGGGGGARLAHCQSGPGAVAALTGVCLCAHMRLRVRALCAAAAGVLSGEKQRIERSYDFIQVCVCLVLSI